jgi:hypothetical protein
MSEVASQQSNPVLEAVLDAGVWELGTYKFATGKTGNNKLFMDRLLKRPEQAEMFLSTLGALALSYEPDGLWGVPSGGQQFAIELGHMLDLPVVKLKKVSSLPGHKTFQFATPEDEVAAKKAARLAAIEDVTNEFTSLKGALDNSELRRKTYGVASGWRRGHHGQAHGFFMPIKWVIEAPLPNIITPDHPFYQKYGHRAVRQNTV